MAKNSSRRWLQEHFSDTYVKQAKQAGYRCRAVYKILELQEKDRLFKPGMTVVDLGASPGGWAQVIVKLLGKKGRLIALDLLLMDPLDKVEFIQGDFSDDAVLEQITNMLGETKPDWILSDMSPNISGIDSVDQPKSMALAELALDFALTVLKPEGGFLVKAFQGEGFELFLTTVRKSFKQVFIRKPKASRDRSREVYILAKCKK